jgi:hypothetical protein
LLVQIVAKNVYIYDTGPEFGVGYEYEPDYDKDKYHEFEIENQDDMDHFYRRVGSAFFTLENPAKKITKFKQLVDGEKYCVYSRFNQVWRDYFKSSDLGTYPSYSTPKTIFIHDVDDKWRYNPNTLSEFIVENDRDLRNLFEGIGTALYSPCSIFEMITSLNSLLTGKNTT